MAEQPPILTPQKRLQDVSPAKPSSGSAAEGLVEMETAQNIPVKQPEALPAKAESAARAHQAKQFIESEGADRELDGILKDVSENVRKLAKAPESKRHFSFRKPAQAKKPKNPATAPNDAPATKEPRGPILIIAAAVIVGVALMVAAYLAFRQGQSTKAKAVTPVASITNPLIKTSDINAFGTALQTKIDQLNDAKDFNSDTLSDQTLGL